MRGYLYNQATKPGSRYNITGEFLYFIKLTKAQQTWVDSKYGSPCSIIYTTSEPITNLGFTLGAFVKIHNSWTNKPKFIVLFAADF